MVPAPFVVVLDANVLFPFTLRDTLLRAAAAGFYQMRWTSRILDEMTRNLVSTGTMPQERANRLRAIIEREFPEAEVTGYEHLIDAMPNSGWVCGTRVSGDISTNIDDRFLSSPRIVRNKVGFIGHMSILSSAPSAAR